MLGGNSWGKSAVRVSKLLRGPDQDDFVDLSVQISLSGDVAAAHTDGDNTGVLPTDTMRNTVYFLAHEYLTRDLEAFGVVLCEHFLERPGVSQATVTIHQNLWGRQMATGFIGGGSERRTAIVARGAQTMDAGGVHGLVVLKTAGSAFEGFPRDELTTLPETHDRILATSISAMWEYTTLPTDTTATWQRVRDVLVDHFFSDWSASMQHQGYQMGEAVLAEVEDVAKISLHLPNQHHLPFDLTRFGVDDPGIVFHPVSEPYGDISLTVTRG